MDRKKFKDFLNDNFGMTDGIIMDRLFKHFNKVPTDDLDLEEWVMGFSIFLKGFDFLAPTGAQGEAMSCVRACVRPSVCA